MAGSGRRRARGAFTLIELLVSMAVLLVIMVAVFSMINQTSKIWRGSAARVEAFQNGRAGFEAITQKISQATLNTYWDYLYPGGDRTLPPTRYIRQSELHFISGPAYDLLGRTAAGTGVPPVLSHAVFFQAPLGYTLDSRPLDNVLNACGYFVEFGSDKSFRPGFLAGEATLPERFRYRLMEFQQPGEKLAVYGSILSTDAASQRAWFATPVNTGTATAARPVHVIGENILALILQPKLADDASAPSAAPLTADYSYDSRIAGVADRRRNQLPALVELTMVAIDEPSAIRLDQRFSSQRATARPYPPLADAGGNLLDPSGNVLFQNVANYAADLDELKKNLTALRLNYRVFHTTLAVRGARWSDQ